MQQTYLTEDKRLPKLPVIFSDKVIDKIDLIRDVNKGDENLYQLYEYIDSLKSYIANPVIAWDNVGKYRHNSTGETHIKELGYNVGFTIKTNQTTNTNYVYVFKIVFPLKKLELKIPSDLDESQNKKCLSNDEFCRILIEKYDAYLYSLFR